MGERESEEESQTRLTEERAKGVKVVAVAPEVEPSSVPGRGKSCSNLNKRKKQAINVCAFLGVPRLFFSWLHLRKAPLT